MKKIIFATDNSTGSFLLRIVLGLVVLAHGVQIVSNGISGFLNYFTQIVGLPYFLGIVTVLVQVICSVLLIGGFATRLNALIILGMFAGMIVFVHWNDGFFMNWYGQLEKGHEGFEYHLLVMAMSASLLITGGGRFSADAAIMNTKWAEKEKATIKSTLSPN